VAADVAVVAEAEVEAAEVAAGPDVGVVVVVVVARAVPLPIARKVSHNTRCQCVEETAYRLGKEGRRVSAQPLSYALLRSTLSTRSFGPPWSPVYCSPG